MPRWWGALACLLAWAVVPLAAADLRFAGATRYQVSGSSVALTVERINNNTTGGISGTVRLELWANPAPTVIGTSQIGYRTAVLTLAQLAGGASTTGISSSVAYVPPPAGQRWYFTLYLLEFTGTATNNEGYVARDLVNFPGAPTIQTQPQGGTVNAGEPVALSVTAVGVPAPTYQWTKDGTNIPGATSATLRLPAALSSQAGSYRVNVANSEGSVQSTAATVAVNTVIVKQAARLGNLSVRSIAGTGDQTLTVGFVVGGSGGSKQLLVRGVGPTLASFNLTGFLVDPRLSLYNAQGALLNQNDDWGGGATLANAFSAVGAFPLPATSRDAALFGAIAAGGNSVQVGSGSGTGIALVEAYDADAMTSPARLINLSARNQVGLDSNALFVGFVVAGTGAKTVLIRGVGPALAQFGVGGVLADPRLTVYDAQSRALLSNDDWSPSLASTFAAVGAFALPNASKDAALVTTLVPGAYSAELAGVNRTTGVGLVEVYELPDTGNSSLNVGTAGGGSGTVTLGSGAPITPGSQVTLTANPALGSTFVGWSGPGSEPTPTITVPADRPLVAVFARGPFTLTTSTSGTGSGVVTTAPFGNSFADGTSVTVTAVPAAGSIFAGWSGDVTGAATSQTVTMNANKSAVATFTRSGSPTSGPFTLTLSTTGTGIGTVTSSPAGASFAAGTVVTVTAVPAAGSTFVGWSGDVTGTATSQTVTMNANRTATAIFILSGPPGGGGIPTTRSIYEGTYRGQFNLRYSVTPIANPSQRRITAKSFDLTIELKTNFTFAGTANLQVTRVSANDPWFGALFGQSPNFGLMVLDEPPKNTSSLGSGLLIVFQNGVRLETTTEAGEVHVSTDGTLISSPPTTGTEMKWLAVKGEYKVENSFLGTVPEFGDSAVIVAPVGATWALTRSGL